MTSRRYSRIMEAARYYAAIDNYIKYITDASKHSTNIGSGDPRAASIKLYIKPFGRALAANQMIETSGAEPTWNTYGPKFAGRTTAAAPGDAGLIIVPEDFKAARVKITTGKSAQGIVKVSRVTGLKYLSYGGKSSSVPFGRGATVGETMETAFGEIEAAIRPTLSGNFDISLIREKI